MAWIIKCLTYNYIFYFDTYFSHFILYFSLKKGDYSLSLSLSLSLSIYIYMLLFFFNESFYFCILIRFGRVFDFLSFPSQVYSLPLLDFV